MMSSDDEESVETMLRFAAAPPAVRTPPKPKNVFPNSIQTTPSGDTDLESDPATPRSATSTISPLGNTKRQQQQYRSSDYHPSQKRLYHSPPPPPQRRGMGTGSIARPVILILGLLLFIAFGGFGFLLDQFLRLPGFKRQIELLEAQVVELETQVTRLETAVDDLSDENDRYSSLNGELNATVVELSNINRQFGALNVQLNQSNVELARLNLELGNQTAEFQEHNEELRSLVGFLNQTTFELGQSVEALTDFLDDGVQFYQSSSLRALELDYLVLLRSWDCDFRDFFLGEDFTIDATASIGVERYPLVLEYVENRILDDLCLDSSDWETFIETVVVEGPIEELTTTNLIRGVQNYTTQAFQFYFPSDDDETSGPNPPLQWSDWSDADYQCANLPRTFSWTATQTALST